MSEVFRDPKALLPVADDFEVGTEPCRVRLKGSACICLVALKFLGRLCVA